MAIVSLLLVWELSRLRLRRAAALLVLLCLVGWTAGQGSLVPELAKDRSYASFIRAANRIAGPAPVYLYGGEFDPVPVYFYRGSSVPFLPEEPAILAERLSEGGYVIMAESEWARARAVHEAIPLPLLKSEGRGSEGDVPLVLVRESPRIRKGDSRAMPDTFMIQSVKEAWKKVPE
jgi:hypothetical protein